MHFEEGELLLSICAVSAMGEEKDEEDWSSTHGCGGELVLRFLLNWERAIYGDALLLEREKVN